MTSQAAAFGDRLARYAARLVVIMAFEVQHELVRSPPEGTPVDTGHARSNWVPTVGEPNTFAVGSKVAVNHGAQTRGMAEVARYVLSQGSVFIANAVDYVGNRDAHGRPGLNAGYSPQSPAGFIEAAIARAISTASSVFKTLQL